MIPHTEMGKLRGQVVFEKRMRNLHSHITFNLLAGYPGRDIYSRHLRDRDYSKDKYSKKQKLGR